MKKRNIWHTINVFNKNSMTPTLIIVYAVMILLFSLINPLYVSLANIKGIFANLTISGIMAVGLTTVILTGNFDISIGSILGMAAIVCSKLYNIEGRYNTDGCSHTDSSCCRGSYRGPKRIFSKLCRDKFHNHHSGNTCGIQGSCIYLCYRDCQDILQAFYMLWEGDMYLPIYPILSSTL